MSISRLLSFLLVPIVLTDAALAQSQQLPLVWEKSMPKVYPQAVLLDQMGRDVLYVAQKNGGLAVLDVTNPKLAPRELAVVGIAQLGNLEVMHLTQRKDLLFLALGDFFDANGARAGLAVVSVAKPGEPKVVSTWKSVEKLQGAAAVIVKDNYAYLGAMRHGILVFDISNPKQIEQRGTILPDVNFPRPNPGKIQHPNARGFAIKGQYLYVAFDAGGLRVVDISNPLKPKEISRYVNSGMGKKQQAYNNLVIKGTAAFVAIDYAGLEILDISDPRNIKQIAWWNPWDAHTTKNLWFNSPGHTNQIEHDAKRRLVYLSAGDSDLQVIDVSVPSKPRLVAQHGEPKNQQGVWGLTISKEFVYLAYINAIVPFQSYWSGLKAIKR